MCRPNQAPYPVAQPLIKLPSPKTFLCTASCLSMQAGNHDGYSSGEDSRSGSTYSRPTIQQEPPTRSSLNTNTHASATPTSRQGGAGGAQDGAGDETQLVEDMCTPQGLRAQPDRETLRLFVENAASMSGPVVAQHLQTKMVRKLGMYRQGTTSVL